MTARLHVVLYKPLIHWNTGAIGRTCLGFGAKLHLVKPLGFELDDTKIRRAGLDYWQHVDLAVHENWQDFQDAELSRFSAAYLISKQDKLGEMSLLQTEFDFRSNDHGEADVALIFGNEDKGLTGLPESALRWPSVYIPMAPEIRSYNLANSVNVVLWEAFRQRHKQGGPGA